MTSSFLLATATTATESPSLLFNCERPLYCLLHTHFESQWIFARVFNHVSLGEWNNATFQLKQKHFTTNGNQVFIIETLMSLQSMLKCKWIFVAKHRWQHKSGKNRKTRKKWSENENCQSMRFYWTLIETNVETYANEHNWQRENEKKKKNK